MFTPPAPVMPKILMILGATLLIAGALLQFAPWTLSWFGKLPGDIHFDSGRTQVYIPITSMLVVRVNSPSVLREGMQIDHQPAAIGTRPDWCAHSSVEVAILIYVNTVGTKMVYAGLPGLDREG